MSARAAHTSGMWVKASLWSLTQQPNSSCGLQLMKTRLHSQASLNWYHLVFRKNSQALQKETRCRRKANRKSFQRHRSRWYRHHKSSYSETDCQHTEEWETLKWMTERQKTDEDRGFRLPQGQCVTGFQRDRQNVHTYFMYDSWIKQTRIRTSSQVWRTEGNSAVCKK